MPHEKCLCVQAVYKLLHDLRGPVVNAKALGTELSDSIADLSTAIEKTGPGLSDQHRERIDGIISQDIVVCTDLLKLSIDTLEERIREIEQIYSG